MTRDCSHVRELISAAADGEADPLDEARATAHVAGCTACRNFQQRVESVDRRVRVRRAEVVPDFTESILEAARPPVSGRRSWVRISLAACALAIFARSLPLIFASGNHDSEVHLVRHLGAFNIALALGLAFAVAQPQRAFGLLPLAAALVGAMAFGATVDVVQGGHSATAELSHLLEVTGLVLLWMLAGVPGAPRSWRRIWRRRPDAPPALQVVRNRPTEKPVSPDAVGDNG